MARRQPTNQYGLDFESQHNERFALWISAIEAAGLNKYKPLALFVFNNQEKHGDDLGYTMQQYAAVIGGSINTARRWLYRLAAIGFITIEERSRVRGGQKSNRVAINW